MKKIKLALLLFLLFIVTGCSVDYNLIVTSNHKIRENVKLFVRNDQISKKTTNLKKYFKDQIASYENIGSYKKYKFDYKIGDEVSYVKLDAWHSSFGEYKKSIIYNNLFEDVFIFEEDDKITFKTVGKYFYSDVYADLESPDPDYYMGDINVKIRLHNKIIDSNADNYDEDTNTLEWTITDKDQTRSIFFEIGPEKRYDIILKDLILLNKKTIIVTSIIVLSVGSLGFYFYSRYKRNNAI